MGRSKISPRGESTNTYSPRKSLRMLSTNSRLSSVVSRASRICRSQLVLRSSMLCVERPSLYIQCAAMPYSAVRCISCVRICTSKGIPLSLSSVVCSERYMFGFGVAI